MTKDEIIEMAKQAGFEEHQAKFDTRFEPFAKLVAEREREACAKLCDDRVTAYQYATDEWAQEHINEAKHLSQAIRARGQK